MSKWNESAKALIADEERLYQQGRGVPLDSLLGQYRKLLKAAMAERATHLADINGLIEVWSGKESPKFAFAVDILKDLRDNLNTDE